LTNYVGNPDSGNKHAPDGQGPLMLSKFKAREREREQR